MYKGALANNILLVITGVGAVALPRSPNYILECLWNLMWRREIINMMEIWGMDAENVYVTF